MKPHIVLLFLFLLLENTRAITASKQHGGGNYSDQRQSQFRYRVNLDTTGHLDLSWDIEPERQRITFKLDASQTSNDLLLFGFSDYGESTNADLLIMWTDLARNHWIQDGHTDSSGRLHVDKQQDYTVENMEESPEGISLVFHRTFDTCDDDDYLIDEGTTHMIFTTAQRTLPAVAGLDVTRITFGLQRVQLLKSQLPDPEFPEDTWSFIMHVDNVDVPESETTYWCAVRKLPHLTEAHHIVQTEGAISPAGEGIVHHLEVFHCEAPPDEEIKLYNGPCGPMEARPKGLEVCRKVIGAWAMGATTLTYPKEAGYPIGGPGYSRYVMLEVHYNNPEHVKGIADSSGLTFTVTKTLREYNAGVIELGQEYTDKMALPPGQLQWNLNGYCLEECTTKALPNGGIKIFASQLHTHLTGKRAYTKHYRRGVELSELSRDNHYSPHYQEIRKLKKQVHILPGDSLITTCEDSTIGRKHITLGGFAISDEMCVNYVHYYPRVELEVCKSSVTTDSLYGFFDFMRKYQGEGTSPIQGISTNFQYINWTPINVELLKTFYDNSPISMQCNQSDGRRFPGNWEGLHKPIILSPQPPAERPCLD